MSLPPGPRAPMIVQTASFLRRPFRFMARCRERYGEMFSVRLGFMGSAPGVVVGSSEPLSGQGPIAHQAAAESPASVTLPPSRCAETERSPLLARRCDASRSTRSEREVASAIFSTRRILDKPGRHSAVLARERDAE
jgi:hypothetical protein